MTDERMVESLSALMDNEANELEIERVLSRIGGDGELRSTWVRYNMARDSVQGHRVVHESMDISARVREAIAGEAGIGAGEGVASLRERLGRPIASLAVAATVAATVVLGGQQLSQLSGQGYEEQPRLSQGHSPVGFINTPGAVAVPASYGMQAPVLQPATHSAYEELARNRSAKFMQEHAQEAALNSPQGLLPYVRIPDERR